MTQQVIGMWTIGADPEMFCSRNGQYVAVQNVGITGTKKKPQPLPMGGNAQRDNVAVEFGVVPATDKVEFVQNIGDTIMDLIDALPHDVQLNIVPSANFPEDQLVHKECKMFGCDPDMNAWTMKINEPPADADKNTFRSCGGHIHVGYVKNSGLDFLLDIDGKATMVRTMDAMLGIVATILDNSPEAIARRKLYGKAGCFRPTEYGVEYRTLSNFWIKSPELTELMYLLTQDCIDIMAEGEAMDMIEALGPDEIRRIIEEGDVPKASDIVIQYTSKVMSDETTKLLWHIMESKQEYKDVVTEWGRIS